MIFFIKTIIELNIKYTKIKLKLTSVKCGTTFLLLLVSILNINAQNILLNEIVANNKGDLMDEDGDNSDWIEIFNPGMAEISLKGYTLTDNPKEPNKWKFPPISIPSKGYLIIFCSGKNRLKNTLHTNFKLKDFGEPIILRNSSQEIVDSIAPTPSSKGFALARICSDNVCYWERLNETTPGSNNLNISLISFSLVPGAFEKDTILSLKQSLGHEIRYTMDGTDPDTLSPIYTSPINLINPTNSPNTISSISTSPYWVAPTGNVMKVNIIRARSFNNGEPSSKIYTKTFGVGPEVTNFFKHYPVFSIEVDSSSLFDFDTGIHVPGANYNANNKAWTGNYFMKGKKWERNVHLEYFEDGHLIWTQGSGMRIHGGRTRNAPQKSLRLYAREEFGAEKFNHQFFKTKNKSIFDKLLLRAHFGCWNKTFIRDEASAYIVRGLDFESQHARPCAVFVNGEFWGLFAIRDYFDSHYIKEEISVDRDSVDIVLNGSGIHPDFDKDWGIVEGDNIHYLALMDFLKNNDLTKEENFNHVSSLIDISSTIDYFCSEIFLAQKDWPTNNYKLWYGGKDTKWRFLFYDLDSGWGYQGPSHNTLVYASHPTGTTIFNPPYATFLFRKLLESPLFVEAFKKRFACLLKNDFSANVVKLALDKFKEFYVPGMPYNIKRWHNVTSITDWENRVQQKLYDFGQNRVPNLIEHIREYFNEDFDPNKYRCQDDTVGTEVVNSTGINLKVYPNPSFDWIWVDSKNITKNGKIRIINSNGQLIFSGNYYYHQKLYVGDLSPGIYHVIIGDGKNYMKQSFVVNRFGR